MIDIQNISYTLTLERYQNELNSLVKQPESNSSDDKSNSDKEREIDERIKLLEQIIEKIKENHNKTKKKKLNFDEVNANIYKKEWHRLSTFHRKEKVKQYINKQYNDLDDKTKKKLLETLTKMVDNKQLSTKKSVNYNKDDEIILDILVLEVDIENNSFSVKNK